jgi:predicted porin
MYEWVSPTSNAVPGISASFNPGNLDNLANRTQLDNAVKYESPSFGGFQFGAMNGFGESADSFGTNRRYAFGAQYRHTNLRVAAAYSMYHDRAVDIRGVFGLGSLLGQVIAPNGMFAADRFRVQGLGASYEIGAFTPHATITDVKISNDNGDESQRNYQLGVNVDVSGNKINLVGLSFGRSTFADREYQQINLFASHLLSKRTQIYVGLNYMKADGDGARAALFGYQPSSDDSQALVRVGMQHQF